MYHIDILKDMEIEALLTHYKEVVVILSKTKDYKKIMSYPQYIEKIEGIIKERCK